MASLNINQGTNSAINFDLLGTVNTQVIGIGYGTVSTIGTLPNLPGGTLNNVASGTINAATAVLNSGTINVGTFVMPSGTLTTGTILSSGTTTGVGVVSVLSKGTISLGSVGGIDANAVAQTGQPVAIGGTDIGGTVRTVLVNSAGAMSVSGAAAGTFVNLSTGTLNVGTINAATVNNGSIVVTAGTISAGTINAGTIGTVTNVGQVYNAGTVQNILAGTITNVQLGTVYKGVAAPTAGSFTAAGSVVVTGSQLDAVSFDLQGTYVGTIFFEGQIGTSAWFAVPAYTPTGVIGTQTTTTGDFFVSAAALDGVRARLTYSSGTLTYNSRSSNFFAPYTYNMGGTIGNVGMVNAATVNGGSIVVTTGTILSSGTTTGVGVVTSLTNGSIVVTSGTQSVGTINTGTVNAGTVNVATITAGTLTNLISGTINAATAILNNGTINVGTFVMPSGTLTTGTILSSGTSTGVGTVTNLGSITNLGQLYNAGTVQNMLAGTVTALQNGTVIKQSPAPLAGSFTAAGSIVQAGSQYDAASFDIQGTWVGTVFFEAQIGTSAWFSIPTINAAGASIGSATLNGDYFVNMTALDGVRARLTYSSGTLNYNSRVSAYVPNAVLISGGSLNQINQITTLSGLVNGSVNILSGTLQASGTSTGMGTLTNLGSVTNIGQVYNAGTLQAGTINTGTINAGTFQQSIIPTLSQSPYGTLGTTGVSVFGTLAGGTGTGAGTEIFVTSISLTIPTTAGSQDVSIGFGTNGGTFHSGTGRLIRGNFPAGGGIVKTYTPAINSGTNAQLCYFQAGAGTVDIDVTYVLTPSTL